MTNYLPTHLLPQNAVSLYDVMKDDWIFHKKKKFLCGMILTIKCDQGKGRIRAFSSRNTTTEAPYDRILTIADLQDPDGTCFVLLYHNHNEAASKMTVLREDDLGVGQKIAIIEPTYKNTFLAPSNDLPIITSKRNIELIPKYPLPTIPYLEHGPEKKTIFFSYTNLKVILYDITMESSFCTGIMCDRQIIKNNPDKTCSCFNKGKYSDVTMDSSLIIYPNTATITYSSPTLDGAIFKKPIDQFRSWLFMKNFFISMPEVTVTTAHFTEDKLDIYRSKVENGVEEVNAGQGWDIVGWSKRGTQKDQAAPTTQQHSDHDMIQSISISPHVCYLQPSSSEFQSISNSNKYTFKIITPSQTSNSSRQQQSLITNLTSTSTVPTAGNKRKAGS